MFINGTMLSDQNLMLKDKLKRNFGCSMCGNKMGGIRALVVIYILASDDVMLLLFIYLFCMV